MQHHKKWSPYKYYQIAQRNSPYNTSELTPQQHNKQHQIHPNSGQIIVNHNNTSKFGMTKQFHATECMTLILEAWRFTRRQCDTRHLTRHPCDDHSKQLILGIMTVYPLGNWRPSALPNRWRSGCHWGDIRHPEPECRNRNFIIIVQMRTLISPSLTLNRTTIAVNIVSNIKTSIIHQLTCNFNN